MSSSREKKGDIRRFSQMNNTKKQRKTIEWERSLQENWRYKGTFHAKMDMMKDRNSMNLRETEEIKKRWQEYTEEL